MTDLTDYLKALKADLLDRRLLPFVALVAVALIVAIGYVALGGGSSSSTPTAAVAPVTAVANGSHLVVSQTSTEQAGAETTEGTSAQHRGTARNPFAAIAGTAAKATSAPASKSGGSSSATTTKETTTTTTKETTTTPTPSKPAKPTVVYHVATLFGVVPAGTAPQTAVLTPFENIKLLTPLPSSQQPLIVFRGVTAGGHSATFTVVGETILHGSANCLPSASQCQAIDLKPGQSEQLEYLPPSGPTVVYELRVVTISSTKVTTGGAQGVLRGESKAGRELLRRDGLVAIPDLHYSTQIGVLAFVAHTGRAHSATRFHKR